MEPNLEWVINNGRDTRFWKDRWLPGVDSLENIIPLSIPINEKEFPISFYCNQEGWNWELIPRYVPSELCSRIGQVRAPMKGQPDFINWKLENDGIFSIKSAYTSLSTPTQVIHSKIPVFQKLGWWKGPARVQSLICKVAHGCLLTNEERCRRGMASVNLFP